MAEVFKVDTRGVQLFAKTMRLAPRKMKGATAMVLNNLAFGTRDEAKTVLGRAMVIRSPRFVFSKKALLTIKARSGAPIDRQVASTASVESDRFSGWAEQQTGKKTDRKRVGTLKARFGSKKRRMAPAVRMRQGRRYAKSENFPGSTKAARVRTMLSVLNNWPSSPRDPFIIQGSRDFMDGLYKMKGRRGKRKLILLQQLDPPRAQPRRFPWMTIARNNYLARVNLTRIWGRAIDRVVRPRR